LSKERIISKLKEILDSESWHISITLITGDFLIGDYFPNWEQKSKENIEKIWFPKCSQRQPEDFRFGLVFQNSFKIVFNSPKGTTHGHANLVDVPFEKIADIKKLSWVNPDIKEKGLKNIPNPLAKIINKCNARSAEKNSLEIFLYCEMALAREGIGDEGISFSEDELIYIDIDFFNNFQSSFAIGPMSFGSSIGAYALANTVLQNSILQRTLRAISGGLIEPLNLLGFLRLLGQERTTTLEGEECVVILCEMEDSLLPVFIKRKSLSYPFEYMDLIKTKLVFYGELKQIPINMENVRYDKVLFARAIAFLRNQCS